MENRNGPDLEQQMRTILDEARARHDLTSILLTNERGLTIASSGHSRHDGIAAIAPEFVKLGENAVRLGEYESVTCVAVVLEDSHMLIIQEFDAGARKFILALDTATIPKGLKGFLRDLSLRLGALLNRSTTIAAPSA